METLYTRYEDGAFPVVVNGEQITLTRPEGSRVFRSKRSALSEITQTPGARNWTWDRYFKQRRFATPTTRLMYTTDSVFDLFAPEPQVTPVVKRRVYPKQETMGVDLVKRGHEVRKLLFAGFGQKIKSAGYDPDDVLQEVYKGILIRNNGACPFDPNKASFGHYVHMVCNCVVSNFHRKMSRQRKVEPLADETDELVMEQASGGQSVETDELVTSDFGSVLLTESPFEDALGPSVEARIFTLLRQGHTRSEIADNLGLSKALVSKTLTSIRAEAREWVR